MNTRRLLVVLVLAIVVGACSDPLEGKFGEELYGRACAQCHGADLSGAAGPPIGPGSNADVALSDAQVSNVIKVGPGAMPGFDDRLTDAQIDSLVAYLRLEHRGTEGE